MARGTPSCIPSPTPTPAAGRPGDHARRGDARDVGGPTAPASARVGDRSSRGSISPRAYLPRPGCTATTSRSAVGSRRRSRPIRRSHALSRYHEPTDTPDKLDAEALTRMGTAVGGAAMPWRARSRATRSATGSPPLVTCGAGRCGWRAIAACPADGGVRPGDLFPARAVTRCSRGSDVAAPRSRAFCPRPAGLISGVIRRRWASSRQ